LRYATIMPDAGILRNQKMRLSQNQTRKGLRIGRRDCYAQRCHPTEISDLAYR
jgi:hypothetical protein